MALTHENNNDIVANSGSKKQEKEEKILNIGSLNVRTFTECKPSLLQHFMEEKGFTIFGISETNVDSKYAKAFNNDKYIGYFSDSNKKGSGVGIIVSKEIEKYIQKSESIDNRIIYIDIFTKKKKIRIIQIYLHANDKDKKSRLELCKKLENVIHQAHRQRKEVILLGDFNINAAKYRDPDRDTKKWKYEILDNLIKEGLTDTMDELYNTQIPPTYFPRNKTPRKLDFI